MVNEMNPQQVYVLIRTCGEETFLNRAIQSVHNQNYPWIKILVLLDKTASDKINAAKNQQKPYTPNINKDIDFSFTLENNENGAAGMAYEIRKKVLELANDNDIILFLDDDDTLDNPSVITKTVTRMNQYDANLCLVGFNVVDDNNEVIDFQGFLKHNQLIQYLSHINRAVNIEELEQLCFASSLGWTKIYRKTLLQKYFDVYQENKDQYNKFKAYEDFPDFLVFLFKEIKVTGETGPIFRYTKRVGSITSSKKVAPFKEQRTGFLWALQDMAERAARDNKLISNYHKHIKNYLAVKFGDIENLINKYKEDKLPEFKDYSFDVFLSDYENIKKEQIS